MCQTFSTVFLLDCTYKTNKFGMPLLNVVGITSTFVMFNASFAFLHAENEEAYAWVLERFFEVMTPKVLCTDRELALMNEIARVFPGCHNILCCWHINKNILANCKTRFSDVEWQQFLERWNMLVSNMWSNCSMRLLVYSRRPIRKPIQLPGNTLTRRGCLTRKGLLPVTLTSFPTLGTPVLRRWKETTTLSSHISMSALFTS